MMGNQYHLVIRQARKGLLFCLLAVLPLSVSAQVGEYRTDLAVGVNGGYTLNSVGFLPDVPQSMLGGATMGLTVRYTCEKYFKSICAVTAEVNFSQTGWKEDIRDIDSQPVVYADDGTALSYQRRLTYIQIPFLARLGWGRERRGLQGFVQAGPQLGFLLSESTASNIDDSRATLTARSSKIVAQYNMPVERRFDYGIAAGAGIELSVPRAGHFLLEGRYYFGLGNIYKNSKSDFFGRSNISQIVIKATYLFDIVRTKNPHIK